MGTVRYRTDGARARAWARAQGIPVGGEGRVSRTVLDAWRAAGAPNVLSEHGIRAPIDEALIVPAVALALRLPEPRVIEMRAASTGKCILCGNALAANTKTMLCRITPECRRANTRVHNFAGKLAADRPTCARCGAIWLMTSAGERLCANCRETHFWCVSIPGDGHAEVLAYRVSTHRCRVCRLLASARTRALARNIPFSITRADITWNDTCPYLGIRLSAGSRVLHMSSPSLDRIKPALGYVAGNVEVISHQANSMKHAASVGQLMQFARAVIDRYGMGKA